MNTLISVPVRWIARFLLRDDWCQLRESIVKVQNYLEQNPDSCAPIIAQQLLISGEDHRFFRHGGFDLLAITRAIWKRLRFGKIEGASTIEQQLVRVMTGRYERTLTRKFREIFLASLVSAEFGKESLPAIYLHVGYYGWNLHDFPSIHRILCSKGEASIYVLAKIVARLKYPEPRYSSMARGRQIDLRTRHLLRLFQRHSASGTYHSSIYAAIPDRPRTVTANGQAS